MVWQLPHIRESLMYASYFGSSPSDVFIGWVEIVSSSNGPPITLGRAERELSGDRMLEKVLQRVLAGRRAIADDAVAGGAADAVARQRPVLEPPVGGIRWPSATPDRSSGSLVPGFGFAGS